LKKFRDSRSVYIYINKLMNFILLKPESFRKLVKLLYAPILPVSKFVSFVTGCKDVSFIFNHQKKLEIYFPSLSN